MTKIIEINYCHECPHFSSLLGCCHNDFRLRGRHVPITVHRYRDGKGMLHNHRHYNVPDWCPLPEKEEMSVEDRLEQAANLLALWKQQLKKSRPLKDSLNDSGLGKLALLEEHVDELELVLTGKSMTEGD